MVLKFPESLTFVRYSQLNRYQRFRKIKALEYPVEGSWITRFY